MLGFYFGDLIMNQILVLEDDPAIAQTLIFTLKKEGFVALWADSLSKGFEIFYQQVHLAALILDVGLPDGTGFEFCQKVRTGTHLADIPIIFLSARSEEAERVLGLTLGADDYVPKPFSPKELIARLHAIFRRQTLVNKTQHANDGDFYKTIGKHTWTYHADQYRLTLDNTPLTLSKTELALMLALLDNPTRILSREQLLSLISNHPEHRLTRTIDAHIKTLRQKLAAICHDEIIITHRGIGYGLLSGE